MLASPVNTPSVLRESALRTVDATSTHISFCRYRARTVGSCWGSAAGPGRMRLYHVW
jgi:hypothetical protein